MPRYFFNVYHDRAELDDEGEELPDLQAAWREATVTAGQIIQDLDGKLRPGGKDWRLEVTDEFANPLYVIHVSADRSQVSLCARTAPWIGRRMSAWKTARGSAIWGSANRVTQANGRWRPRPRLRPPSPSDDRVHFPAASWRPFRGREMQIA